MKLARWLLDKLFNTGLTEGRRPCRLVVEGDGDEGHRLYHTHAILQAPAEQLRVSSWDRDAGARQSIGVRNQRRCGEKAPASTTSINQNLCLNGIPPFAKSARGGAPKIGDFVIVVEIHFYFADALEASIASPNSRSAACRYSSALAPWPIMS